MVGGEGLGEGEVVIGCCVLLRGWDGRSRVLCGG